MTRLSWDDPTLQLKCTPPRFARGMVERERLRLARLRIAGSQATVLAAAAGYGKSTQLNQWRRELQAAGAVVLWYTVDGRDGPLRWLQGLAQAARAAAGRRCFGDAFLAWMAQCSDVAQALAGWLSQVARCPGDVVLLLDEVEHLPAASVDAVLGALLERPPANLHLGLACRAHGPAFDCIVQARRKTVRLTEADLCLRIEETAQVLSAAVGARCDADTVLALHELTDGWPLGLQLANATLCRGGDLPSRVGAATQDLRRYFVDSVIDCQPPDALALLVELSQFDPVHPALCEAALTHPEQTVHLARLQEETPLLLRAEHSDWIRLHPLARDVLCERLARRPVAERQALAQRASRWYAAHGLYESAAEQARLAGDVDQAIEWVEHGSREMARGGRGLALLTWYGQLSPQELERRTSLWLPAAWALSMGDRHAEAHALVARIAARPGLAPAERFEVALVEATADAFADRIQAMAGRLAAWPEAPAGCTPDVVAIHALVNAFLALYRGDPEQARWTLASLRDVTSPVTQGQVTYCLGLAHLWEGRYALAVPRMREALARAEAALGRLHGVSCHLATALLEARWEAEEPQDADALMAGRLQVLQRAGAPDAVLSAHVTLARMACSKGRQDHAMSMLDALQATGRARGLFRLQVAACSEHAALHARHARPDMARGALQALQDLIASAPVDFLGWARLSERLCAAEVSLSEDDSEPALQAALEARRLARGLQRGRDEVHAMLIQARALRAGDPGRAVAVHEEALSLASAARMQRLLATGQARTAPPATAAAAQKAPTLLTPKEREVLALLSRNLGNKEIARMLGIGDGTVKFHLKNIFQKLDASGRRHAVARAWALGVLPAEPAEGLGSFSTF